MTLDQLAIKHGTDKSSKHHNYAVIYEQYFKHLQDEPILFVECGIGGYEYPDRGGQSAKMWREWFTNATIICTDIHHKSFKIRGVYLIKCPQEDIIMQNVCKDANIFIDDASHINPLTIKTFELVWPVLAPGAFYVIEDIESSWCPADGWAQGCEKANDFNAPTAINLARHLTNSINEQYIPGYNPLHPVKNDVESIHFHRNLVIIKKK